MFWCMQPYWYAHCRQPLPWCMHAQQHCSAVLQQDCICSMALQRKTSLPALLVAALPLRVQVELEHVVCEAAGIAAWAAAVLLHIWACCWPIAVAAHAAPQRPLPRVCKWAADPVVAEALLAGTRCRAAQQSHSTVKGSSSTVDQLRYNSAVCFG